MRAIYIALLLVFSSLTQAFTSNQQDFLPVEKAFRFEVLDDVEPALLVWQIASGYYLYQNKLGITDGNGQALVLEFPEGIDHSDEFFGETQIYRQFLQLPLDTNAQRPLEVTWQEIGRAHV